MEKLLAGDQTAAPADARVERDAQGRIVSVSQTLSPGGTAAADAPKLALGEGLRTRLGEACDWLTNRNISLARAHGIGLEETYAFDQDEGRLELIFSDGRKIVANGQLLGSFDPVRHDMCLLHQCIELTASARRGCHAPEQLFAVAFQRCFFHSG